MLSKQARRREDATEVVQASLADEAERLAALPGFRDLHPHQEADGAQGALRICWELQEAPVMLPPPRFSEALEAAAAAGALASEPVSSDPSG